MSEPVRDETALNAADLFFQGKKLKEIESTLDISKATLWRYLSSPEVKERLEKRRQDSVLLHHQDAIDYCDELQRRAEEAVCTDAKRIQMLLQIFRMKCDLLGMFPKEPSIEINTGSQHYEPVPITFTVVPRKELSPPAPRQLNAAPDEPEGQR